MDWLASIFTSFGFGLCSALIPIFNAEVFTLVAVNARPRLLVPVVLSLALGQTAGKLLLFEAARRGSTRFQASSKLNTLRSGRWSERIRTALTDSRTAIPLVLASSSLGLPPLALVSVAAGAYGQRRRTFAVVCVIGRIARFGALAIPVAYATNKI